MSEQKVENHITEVLSDDMQKSALDFIAHLKANEMQFERGAHYWENKLYWCVNYKGESVCYILFFSPASIVDSTDPWVVWADDSGSKWYENYSIGEKTKETAWKNIDICENTDEICGGCMGKTRKTIFGKEFDNVCGITFRFDNPDTDAVECMKKLVSIRRYDIDKRRELH